METLRAFQEFLEDRSFSEMVKKSFNFYQEPLILTRKIFRNIIRCPLEFENKKLWKTLEKCAENFSKTFLIEKQFDDLCKTFEI